jgi:hypothetical protein
MDNIDKPKPRSMSNTRMRSDSSMPSNVNTRNSMSMYNEDIESEREKYLKKIKEDMEMKEMKRFIKNKKAKESENLKE